MARPTPDPPRPVVGLPLTERERQVLDLVTRTGGSRKAAAAALGINQRTIGRHLESAFRKLGVDNVAAAARELGRAERHAPKRALTD